ncbi:MAG: hypothetical protein D6797_09320 [Bdellovibrio sp.]|nr:MAG: hypothetical protein D6797_09320 [Bdellovibrio sp.]
MKQLFFSIGIVFFSFFPLWADEYITPLREDLSVPSQCLEPRLEDFQLKNIEFFTYSIRSAKEKGFSREFPITRKDAHALWVVLDQIGHHGASERVWAQKYITGKPDLRHLRDLLLKEKDRRGFDFGSEGDVLELISLMDLKKQYPEPFFFITSSYMYHEPHEYRAVGELDVIIGQATNCQVISVGEVKLGLHRLPKAKQQLRRFMLFLKKHH